MVTESERLALHQAMRGIIGAGPADTFMELATPRDWDQVVRTHHLALAVDELRSEFRHDLADLRVELTQDITNLRAEIVDRISSEIQTLSRWIIGVLSTLSVALIVAVVR